MNAAVTSHHHTASPLRLFLSCQSHFHSPSTSRRTYQPLTACFMAVCLSAVAGRAPAFSSRTLRHALFLCHVSVGAKSEGGGEGRGRFVQLSIHFQGRGKPILNHVFCVELQQLVN